MTNQQEAENTTPAAATASSDCALTVSPHAINSKACMQAGTPRSKPINRSNRNKRFVELKGRFRKIPEQRRGDAAYMAKGHTLEWHYHSEEGSQSGLVMGLQMRQWSITKRLKVGHALIAMLSTWDIPRSLVEICGLNHDDYLTKIPVYNKLRKDKDYIPLPPGWEWPLDPNAGRYWIDNRHIEEVRVVSANS